MNKELVICVPTYNRPLMIQELLIRNLKKYSQYGWDLFIFDSSTDNKTKIIVENYSNQFSNLFYEYIDSSVHSNLKVYTIFERFGKSLGYKYIWVCSDTLTWSRKILDIVQENLKFNYDLIITNYRDVEKIGSKEFMDYNEFFISCAWYMNLYGATILKIDTMLQNVPWEYLKEKYCIPERINFSHVAYYFEKVYMMKEFKAKHLAFESKELQFSALKKANGWRNETFFVWCTCWPSMIMALPDCYNNKERVIQQIGVNSGLFLEPSLIKLREEGIYTYDIYKQYKDKWNLLTTVPNTRLKILSLIPAKCAWLLQFDYFYDIRRIKRRVIRFARKYPIVYFYGCGTKAARFAGYLDDNNIDYQGFIVTSMDQEKSIFMNKKVQLFSASILTDPNVGLIMALNSNHTQEVMNMIEGTNEQIQCGIFQQ